MEAFLNYLKTTIRNYIIDKERKRYFLTLNSPSPELLEYSH